MAKKKETASLTPEEKQDLLTKLGLDKSFKNSPHVICGVDPSLQKTGIIILNSKGDIIHEALIKPKKLKGIERLIYIRDQVLSNLKKFGVTVVAIEGYSFGSRGRATFSLGELGGVLRVGLKDHAYDFFDVSPSSLKSFVADNGSADKVMMRQAVKNKYKLDIQEDNICDAFGLARMCLVLGESMPKYCAKGGAQLMKKVREKHNLSLF